MKSFSLFLGFVGLVALISCEEAPAALFPPMGYEFDDKACSDQIDNDQDGAIDCDDPDCLMGSTHCGEQIPNLPFFEAEGPGETCFDQIDNDEDGQFDCGDSDCRDVPENCCGGEFTDADCSDGQDNDQNGFADCADFGCRMGIFVTVCEGWTDDTPDDTVYETTEDTITACSDGVDNDGNGYTDCGDFSCSKHNDPAVTAMCEVSLETCSDGLDNDGNSFTDCQDFSCSMSTVAEIIEHCDGVEIAEENTLETCTDGLDNDSDGFVDCADFDCESEAFQCGSADLGEETSPAACTDGLDNDGDGFIDCKDFDCESELHPEIAEFCVGQSEEDQISCSDGIDNDGNGYTDCGDFGCSASANPLVRGLCQESLYRPLAGSTPSSPLVDACIFSEDANCNHDKQLAADMACSDGGDGDSDGYIDCADFDCAYNPLVTVCNDDPKVCE